MNILIVDDEIDLLKALEEDLLLRGHIVFTSNNGNEALELLQTEQHIDVVISDFKMPKMNGLVLSNEIPKYLKRPPPFILVSGTFTVDRPPENKNIFRTLSKPYPFKDLEVLLDLIKVGDLPVATI